MQTLYTTIKSIHPQQKILIEIPNTKGISSELLKTLNKDVSIRIEGGYDKERANRLGQIKDFHETTGIYCTTSVIYTRDETISIISEMEELFANSNKLIVKAIIALTMGKLPMPFTTSEDVKDYVVNALEHCTDKSELVYVKKCVDDII